MSEGLWDIENEIFAQEGIEPICGVDEAGRGPLAGPVCAAAVILPRGLDISGLNDSKKLNEKKREELYRIIVDSAVAWSAAFATVDEIEEINILQATYLAMNRAIEGLAHLPKLALIDGNQSHGVRIQNRTIVKGDSKCASIAAASIIAKVTRDRYMMELAEKYPQYRFEKHKGYGTKLHYEMLREHGISPEHRKYYLRKMH